MNKPRTQPNSNKKWTTRNGELEILEILNQAGFYPTDYIRRRISNVLDRVAEYHVFEGYRIKDEKKAENNPV